MTIEAKIIADSLSPQGVRLTTMQLRYPRFIHAEVKTHRVIKIGTTEYEETLDMGFMDDPNLSRNASSSRAIPVERMIAELRRDPAMPVFWGSNKPGMQAGAELEMHDLLGAKAVWLAAMEDAIAHAETLMKAGLHKQIANRILEPWAHINVVVTATDYQNFYNLRRHKDAQPEIKALADVMWFAQQISVPEFLDVGQWHLPFVTEEDRREANYGPSQTYGWESLKRISTARCARVSFLTHEGKPSTLEEDLTLYERLVGSQPLHASPAEHQATPDDIGAGHTGEDWQQPELHGNFEGWIQHRKLLELEVK